MKLCVESAYPPHVFLCLDQVSQWGSPIGEALVVEIEITNKPPKTLQLLVIVRINIDSEYLQVPDVYVCCGLQFKVPHAGVALVHPRCWGSFGSHGSNNKLTSKFLKL